MDLTLFSRVQNCLPYHWAHIKQPWGYVSWIDTKEHVKGPLMWFESLWLLAAALESHTTVNIGGNPPYCQTHCLDRTRRDGQKHDAAGLTCEELFGWPPSMGLRKPTDLTRTCLCTAKEKYVVSRSCDCLQQVDVKTLGLVKMAQHL